MKVDHVLAERIKLATGKQPVALEPVIGGGYSLALRLKATFSDGQTAFIKVATTDDTASFLRTEHHVYASLGSQPFMPEFLGWHDDGTRPILMLEDLGKAVWPPPWITARVDAVLNALDLVRRAPKPKGLPKLEEMRSMLNAWQEVADNPTAFLSTGFCSQAWLDYALPDLLKAEQEIVLEGNDLLHVDVRSDNLCFPEDSRAVIVDWNWASVGNGELDIAAWLPSLQAEGGPKPEAILPNAQAFAAALSGFFAVHAGLPAPDFAPRVRTVQKQQLGTGLPWVARALGLPKPDGTATELIL